MEAGRKMKQKQAKHSTGTSNSISKTNRKHSNEKESILHDQQQQKMTSHFSQGHNFNSDLY